jgi:hypothetical protein
MKTRRSWKNQDLLWKVLGGKQPEKRKAFTVRQKCGSCATLNCQSRWMSPTARGCNDFTPNMSGERPLPVRRYGEFTPNTGGEH